MKLNEIIELVKSKVGKEGHYVYVLHPDRHPNYPITLDGIEVAQYNPLTNKVKLI